MAVWLLTRLQQAQHRLFGWIRVNKEVGSRFELVRVGAAGDGGTLRFREAKALLQLTQQNPLAFYHATLLDALLDALFDTFVSE